MHWPETFPEAEIQGIDSSALPNTESLATQLDFATLHADLAQALKSPLTETQTSPEGSTPNAFYDDLLDVTTGTQTHSIPWATTPRWHARIPRQTCVALTRG